MSLIEHTTEINLEMCSCGHVRKDHADGQPKEFSKALSEVFAFGHGYCRYALGSCSCQKFTWVGAYNPKFTSKETSHS